MGSPWDPCDLRVGHRDLIAMRMESAFGKSALAIDALAQEVGDSPPRTRSEAFLLCVAASLLVLGGVLEGTQVDQGGTLKVPFLTTEMVPFMESACFWHMSGTHTFPVNDGLCSSNLTSPLSTQCT